MPGCFTTRRPLPLHFMAIASAATLLFTLTVRGQQEVDVLPVDGTDSLELAWKEHRELAKDLITGKRVADPKDPSHIKALDVEAKYVTYRFTWPIFQTQTQIKSPTVNQSSGIDSLFQQLVTDVKSLNADRQKTTNAIPIFVRHVTDHALEVLQTRRLIARVNAARVLSKLADLGILELADDLLKVLQDPAQNDAVKFYILCGLHNLASQSQTLTPKHQKRIAEVLIEFINHKATTTLPEEIEGVRYVRREAIRTLAQFHDPELVDKGQLALILLRIMANDDSFVPPPRIDERLEAAIGLARLKPVKDYNSDYAIVQIVRFLDDFNLASNQDRQQMTDSKGQQRYAWRVLSARLNDALDQMAAEKTSSGDPLSPYVTDVVKRCSRLLDQLEKGSPVDVAETILQYIATSPPSSDRLFKSIENSSVKPANRLRSVPRKEQ